MKAAVINEFGDTGVLKLTDVPTPQPRPGHVLVKILAAGINRFDHYLREGSIVPELNFPHILGADAAGEVFRLGKGVTGFEIGERVIPSAGWPTDEADWNNGPANLSGSFTLPGFGIPGTYAQYLEVPAPYLVKDITGLPPEQVATLPMVLATSVHAIRDIGNVQAGDAVLVTAGASGSGSMHIQVAKALGARVAATIRDESKRKLVEQAGADLVINTREENLVERVQKWTDGDGADVVIDNLAGKEFVQSMDAARAGGVIVAYGFAAGPEVSFDIRKLFFGQKQLRGTMASDVSDLKWGLEQVAAGKIRPFLDQTFPLSQAGEAHRRIANNEVKGNLVLLPWAA